MFGPKGNVDSQEIFFETLKGPCTPQKLGFALKSMDEEIERAENAVKQHKNEFRALLEDKGVKQ